jgi:hypothetical protein
MAAETLAPVLERYAARAGIGSPGAAIKGGDDTMTVARRSPLMNPNRRCFGFYFVVVGGGRNSTV